MLNIFNGEMIIAKGSKICGLYILKGFNVVVHSSSATEDTHDKNKLWDLISRHSECLKVAS